MFDNKFFRIFTAIGRVALSPHQPITAQKHRHRRTGQHQGAVGLSAPQRASSGHESDQRRERRHGKNGADAITDQVGHRLETRREGQRGQHPQDVRAAGQAVQQSDGKDGVPVSVGARF